MKKNGFIQILVLFFLLTFNAFGITINDNDISSTKSVNARYFIIASDGTLPTGSLQSSSSIIDPNIPTVIENYGVFTPDFNYIKKECNPIKIASGNKAILNLPYVYEDYIVYEKDNKFYLWSENGQSKLITSIPENSWIEDFNDYKIIYGNQKDLYIYDIKTEESKKIILPDSKHDISITYDKGQLSYVNYKDKRLYFISNGINQSIYQFNDEIAAYEAFIQSQHNGKMAWWDKVLDYYQIFYWDGTKIIQLTTNSSNNFYPSLHNGKIAWINQHGSKPNYRDDIYFWDGTKIIQITNDGNEKDIIKTYNGKIAWDGKKDGKYQIFYWDGSVITQVTDNNYNNIYPDLYNGRLVWVRGGKDIYTCVIDPPTKPSAITYSASNITTTEATLNAQVNPNEQETEYRFEYSRPNDYPKYTNWISIGNGSSSVDVSNNITGLTPDTTYKYRVVAKNASGTSNGTYITFKTQSPTPVLPTVSTGDASGIGTYNLSATINPNGFDTTYYFEFGTDTNYGNRTPENGAGSGNTNVIVTTQLNNLSPGTTYHYRIVAKNAAGTITGEDKTFTTLNELELLMPVPSGQHTIKYLAVSAPITDIDPSKANPFAVGNLLAGNLNLQVGLKGFENPVDIYLAITFDKIPGKIFFIDSANELKQTAVAWKTGHTDKINDVSLYGNIPTDKLTNGVYTLYLLVVPADATNMDNSYLWITNFNLNN